MVHIILIFFGHSARRAARGVMLARRKQ